jgi:hypothetical protein
MTAVLRDATLQIHGAVSEQNIQLESIKQSATENVDEINRQKKKVRLFIFFISAHAGLSIEILPMILV